MFSSLKITIIIYLLAAAAVGLIGWRVNHAFNEAAKVPGLELKIDQLEEAARQYQAKLDAQFVEAQKRLAENQKLKENQATQLKNLRKENAKTPSIVIPADKLQALRAADRAKY